MSFNVEKVCPYCGLSFTMNFRAIIRASYIKCTWGGPRVYCSCCFKSLDFSRGYIPVILPLVLFIATVNLTNSIWASISMLLAAFLIATPIQVFFCKAIKS